jgi:hypothetical protein
MDPGTLAAAIRPPGPVVELRFNVRFVPVSSGVESRIARQVGEAQLYYRGESRG